jgi:hypothetical protein
MSDNGSTVSGSPLLIVLNEGALPPHSGGGEWRWLMTSSEEPRRALIGRELIRLLKRDGRVITPLPLERILRIRPTLPTSPSQK